MALNASGKLSVGGLVTGESIELELGMSGTVVASLNDDNFRALANVSSGTISIDTFHGRQSTWAKRTNSFAQNNSYERWNDISVSSTGQYIVIVSSSGWVVISTNYGRTWSTQSDNTSGTAYFGCAITDDGNWVYLIGDDGAGRGLWRNTYSGNLTNGFWTKVYTFEFAAVYIAIAKNYTPYPGLFVMAGTSYLPIPPYTRYCKVYKSTDNGASFSTILSLETGLATVNFSSISCSDDGNRIVVGNGGTRMYGGPPVADYYYTTNGGSTWAASPDKDISFQRIKTDASGSKIVASQEGGGLWYTSPFGGTYGNFDSNPVTNDICFTLSRDGSTIYAGYPGLSSIKKATSFYQYSSDLSNVYYPNSTGYGLVGCSANGSFVVATAAPNNGAIYTSV